MDGQIDIAEVRRFFYHLGAASRDDRCRVRIAAEFDHPKGLPLVKGKDFLDALAEEPLETLKVSGWIRSFGSSFLSQISSGGSQWVRRRWIDWIGATNFKHQRYR